MKQIVEIWWKVWFSLLTSGWKALLSKSLSSSSTEVTLLLSLLSVSLLSMLLVSASVFSCPAGPTIERITGSRRRPWNRPNTTVSTNTYTGRGKDNCYVNTWEPALKNVRNVWDVEAPNNTKARNVVNPPLKTAGPMDSTLCIAFSTRDPGIRVLQISEVNVKPYLVLPCRHGQYGQSSPHTDLWQSQCWYRRWCQWWCSRSGENQQCQWGWSQQYLEPWDRS